MIQPLRTPDHSKRVEREGQGADIGESQSQWNLDPFYGEQGWEARKELTQAIFGAKFVHSSNRCLLSTLYWSLF